MAKMNTEGYTRQTIQQSAVYYSTSSNKYAVLNRDKIGQGVTIDSLVQIRDQFLDGRFRTANSESSALTQTIDILEGINNIFDETLNNGLGVMVEEFYQRLQTLSLNTGKLEFSDLVRSSAQKITETLKFYSNQLNTVSGQQRYELSMSVDDANRYLDKISDLNKSIQYETVQGNPTNELLDTRNLYLDKLSGLLNISTQNNSDGTVSIKCGSKFLIDAAGDYQASLSLDYSSGITKVVSDNEQIKIDSGKIMGFIELLDGKGDFALDTENDFCGIPYYLESLDRFSSKFAETFNNLNGDGKPLFAGDSALTINISDGWAANANYITSTTDGDATAGKNNNIIKMLHAFETPIEITEKYNGTFEGFVTSLMSRAGIDADYYSDLSKTADTILISIDNQRESVKGVSLNEETVNLMKYQKAFEASARLMTAMDEMLDTIINRMGTVGR